MDARVAPKRGNSRSCSAIPASMHFGAASQLPNCPHPQDAARIDDSPAQQDRTGFVAGASGL
jgi:hypothetical protein